MLTSIRIEQFKSIVDATLELGNVTVLVGPNNAGKSSVLQSMQFAVSIAQSLGLDGSGRWISGTLSGTLSAQQLMYSPLQDVYALANGGMLRQQGNEIKVSFETDDLGDCVVSVRRGRNKNISVSATGRTLMDRLEDVTHPYSVFAPGLAGIPSSEEFRAEGTVTRAAARGDANSVFRNVLWRLRQDAAAWSAFEQSLSEIFPGVQVEVGFDERTGEYIEARVNSGGVTVPIDASGTGVLQAIQVLAYIGLYQPKMLILDEPDSHLHPDNQRKLARLLVKLTEAGGLQVLISTHSRHFLDEFGSLGAKIVWFSSGESRPTQDSHLDVLLELGALDAGDRLRNGALPAVVITEDSDRQYLDALMHSSGWAAGEYDVWSYKGSTKIDAALVLAQFIASHAPGTKIIIHRDSDFAPVTELDDYRASIEAAGAHVLATDGTDIESFFLRHDHLKHIFLELTDEEIEAALTEATSATEPDSLRLLTDDRYNRALRERKVGGPTPSAGTASASAKTEYDADPIRFRHGKKTLGAFRGILQRDHSLNKPVAVQSTALEVNTLRELADEVHT